MLYSVRKATEKTDMTMTVKGSHIELKKYSNLDAGMSDIDSVTQYESSVDLSPQ